MSFRIPSLTPPRGWVWALLVAFLLQFFHAPRIFAQGTVERSVRVEVPIQEDNLEEARAQAMKRGQREAVMSLVRDLVAPEWVTLFDKEINQRILRRLDRYITSYQMQNQVTAPDRTKYSALFTTKLNRLELAEDLRQLALPLLSDTLQEVTLIYSSKDVVLSHGEMLGPVQAALEARLALLRLEPKNWMGLAAEDAEVLANPQGATAPRERVLSRQKQPVAAFIRFEAVPVGEGKEENKPGIRTVILFYHRGTGALLGQMDYQARHERFALPLNLAGMRKILGTQVLEPLANRLLPGVVHSTTSLAGAAPELRLRVLGLQNLEDEENFEQSFFRRGSAFERFYLHLIGSAELIYAGSYNGDRLALESEWRGKTVGPFIIQDVSWYKDMLEFDLERKAKPNRQELTLFPKQKRSPDVNGGIEAFFEKFAQLEVEDPLYAESEDNGWITRSNQLAFGSTVYGFLDARSDSDFYVGEALNPGEELTLVWYRVGRTNLTPIVRIYNEKGIPIQSYYPRSWLSAKVRIPKGERRFYVEIADRYGYLRMDTGGYLSLGYLFKISRESNGSTAQN